MQKNPSSAHPRPAQAFAAGVAVLALATGCGAGTQTDAGQPTPTASPPTALAQTASPGTEVPNGATIVPDGGDLPNGVYRAEFTEQHLTEHGLDPESVAGNRGVWSATLEDGHWTVEQVAADLTDRFEGVYQVEGDNLYWRFHDNHEVLHLTWSTDEDGDLHFTQVTDTGRHQDFQFVLPWTRVD